MRGDININGQPYRIDLPSYRVRDVVDFSPRASTPGGSVIHSDLMLYQPLLQTDWRHGFGFQWYADAMGYMRTEGNIDTRQEGIVSLFTAKTSSDTNAANKKGGIIHKGHFYTWGNDGVRRFDGTAWETMTYQTTPVSVNTMFSNGEYLFASPYNARIRKTINSHLITIQSAEAEASDTYINEAATTTNYGNNNSLRAGTDAATKHTKSLFKPIGLAIPAGATVTSAKLKLYIKSKSASAPALKIKRILVAGWTETGATWEHSVGTTDWNTAGASGSGTDVAAADLYSDTPTEGARQFVYFDLDLTEFALLAATNYGVIIQEAGVTASQYWEFASASDPNADWRPTLEFKYTLSTEWSDAGADAGAKDYGWFIIHGGKIYAGKRATNIVHYSTTADMSDLEGTTADPDKITVGVGSVPVLGAISYASFLYFARADGLWQLGDDNIARRVLDFSSSISNHNFRSMAVHNGYLIFPIQDTLYQWNGSRLSNITPRRLNDTFPYVTYGRFDNLLQVGDFLYCTARTNDSTYEEDLLCWDGTGWHKLIPLVTDGIGSVSMLAYDSINNYLWLHIDAASQVTYYIPLQANSPFPYASFPTSGTHSVISSRWDMGFRRVKKSTPSLLIEASNVSTSAYLLLYYSIDGQDWVQWGAIIQDGISELKLPGGSHSQEFNYIQLRVDFITSTATTSPVLEGLTLRFLMRPEVAFGWNVNIPVADQLVYGEHQDPRMANDIWTDLKAARDSKAPIKFTDIDNVEYYVYLTSMTAQAVERNVDTERGGVASIEKFANINLVEAK